eukprot:NODE_139_length_2389_cov_64.923932_g121_i0.p1 GENE.NODE_139_length_2389_cov_64.923932_g121_i0~~NODE_139_length_2389_cov_64.923932_g121_i0.p1  ORF type:complete len:753 (+),score=267.26 NODE_139_length_2389_cov_64.923932_g121_i0:25-2259(+)
MGALESAVECVMPLHDMVWNRAFVKRFGASLFHHGQALWIEDLVRNQFGERVALYFAFMHHYIKWLKWLALFMLVFYIIVRNAHWPTYQIMLMFLGFFTPTLWGTMMARCWHRRTKVLSLRWGRDDVTHDEFPNVHEAHFEHRYNPVTGENDKIYDPKNNRLKVMVYVGPIIAFNMLLLLCLCIPFVQWYMFGKMSPTCRCCEFYLSSGLGNGSVLPNATGLVIPKGCELDKYHKFDTSVAAKECTYWRLCFNSASNIVFVTDRWYYILFQGIALGLIMDVAQFELFRLLTAALVRRENWALELEYQQSLIRKQFFFMWYNMYFWFFIIAFAYVPFGPSIQEMLKDIGFGWIVPSWGWKNKVINIDEAFVTPMVATQSINLTLEAFVPLLVTAVALRTARRWRQMRKTLRWEQGHTVSEAVQSRGDSATESLVHQLAKSKNPVHHNVSIHDTTPDRNCYDASEVFRQSKLGVYDTHGDYLDMMMQLGYICNFTQAWALAPVAAIVNNFLEIRSDAFKLCYGSRRPVPRPDGDVGEWQNTMYAVPLLAIPVVSGLITLATGQLDRISGCAMGEEEMAPNLSCLLWGTRLLAAIVIEHWGFAIAAFVVYFVPSTPGHIVQALRDKKVLLNRKIQNTFLPGVDEETKRNLRVIFEHYDQDDIGFMHRGDVLRVLGMLQSDNAPPLTEDQVEALYHRVDISSSGTVSFAELSLALVYAESDFIIRSILDIESLPARITFLAMQLSGSK